VPASAITPTVGPGPEHGADSSRPEHGADSSRPEHGADSSRPEHGATWSAGPAEGRSGAILSQSCVACARGAVTPAGTERPAITSPEAAAEVLVPELAERDRERCVALLLDTKHRLLESVTVSVGSIDHTFMAPREVYRDALLANAAALVLAHNHPSGDPEPSHDDEALTRRLARAGELVGIELLDHLVVGGQRWVSLARRGGL
jgi:DNA repair protein RadC